MKNYSTQTGNTKPLQKSRALKQCAVARQGIASKIGSGFNGNLCDNVDIIEPNYSGYLTDRSMQQ